MSLPLITYHQYQVDLPNEALPDALVIGRSVLQIAHYITIIPGEHGALGKGPIAITRNAQVLYQLHVVLRPRLQLRNSTKVLRSSRYEQLATKVLYHSDLLITIYYLRQKGCLLCL